MIRTQKRMRLCIALLLCNLVFIWGNSLLPGEVSGTLSDWAQEVLHTFLPEVQEPAQVGSGMLRKVAHFTEFMSLGMVLGWLFGMLQKGKALPLALGCMAACLDESIQLFIPGRGPGLRDVLIDSSGVVAGILLLHLGYACIKKKKRKHHLEEP